MPILDLGYRGHDGKPRNRIPRWMSIAANGIRLAWRGTWLRRTLILTSFPAVICALSIFALEQVEPGSQKRFFRSMAILSGVQGPNRLSIPSDYKRDVYWPLLMANFFRYPQSIAMVLLVGLIAPRSISFDYRSKGALLYFSRPIGVTQYLLGKQATLWFYLACITTIPALVVYVLGLAVSPNLSVFWDTWDLPIRILISSLCLIIPTSSVALWMSSMTEESRYAAFGWLAMWVLGWVTFFALTLVASMQNAQSSGGSVLSVETIALFSPYHLLGRIQNYVFGVIEYDTGISWAFTILMIVTVATQCMLYWNVRSRLVR
ncbi:MAG: hypothetical protein AAF958_16005 [Planctomycetota bacterium]